MDWSESWVQPRVGGKSFSPVSPRPHPPPTPPRPPELSRWKAESKDTGGDTQSCKLQYSTAELKCWHKESASVHFGNERARGWKVYTNFDCRPHRSRSFLKVTCVISCLSVKGPHKNNGPPML